MAVARTDKRYTIRNPRPTSPRSRAAASTSSVPKRSSQALPGWKDLSGGNQRARNVARGTTFLERISTTRFALLVIALAVLFTLYVGHVHATQNLLAEVQTERRDNLRLHLQYNRLKGDFDQMVGPAVIYRRANELGLVEDPAFGPTIEVDE